jgi:hypothetical protein
MLMVMSQFEQWRELLLKLGKSAVEKLVCLRTAYGSNALKI